MHCRHRSSHTLAGIPAYKGVLPRFVLANGVKNEQASSTHTHKYSLGNKVLV